MLLNVEGSSSDPSSAASSSFSEMTPASSTSNDAVSGADNVPVSPGMTNAIELHQVVTLVTSETHQDEIDEKCQLETVNITAIEHKFQWHQILEASVASNSSSWTDHDEDGTLDESGASSSSSASEEMAIRRRLKDRRLRRRKKLKKAKSVDFGLNLKKRKATTEEQERVLNVGST